jgi:nucleotide-binding universal stress UspA family protein
MSFDPKSYQASVRDFHEARFQAALRDMLARLTRTSDELLSYEQVAEQLGLTARRERGIQTIPVAAIVGSVGRAADFTRTFLPRRSGDWQRWARVRTAFLESDAGLPPIEVYKVGEAYFVLDGNHRVSVARREGQSYIEARVIEIETPVPLTPEDTPDDLICRAEYANFIRATGLENESHFDFAVARCGQYPKLVEQIEVHRVLASRAAGRDLSLPEAASDWVERVYAPLVHSIRDHGLARWFPDLTEADLFLWVIEHQEQLRQELGWAVRPDAAITDLAVRSDPRARATKTAPGTWRAERLSDRYLEHLFMDLLVPLSGGAGGWNALAQGLEIAQKENAAVHGLHIIRPGAARTDTSVEALRAEFQERLAAANVGGDLALESGDVVGKIRERALLADLIVLDVAHPPQGRFSALTSRWRALVKNSPRPILAVPSAATAPGRALLVFDGTPNAEQALFVAAYMGESWGTALTVLIPPGEANAAQKQARAYLDFHELDADYISFPFSPTGVRSILAERDLDLVLLGNDSGSQWRAVRGRSLVSALLRESPLPLLIC